MERIDPLERGPDLLPKRSLAPPSAAQLAAVEWTGFAGIPLGFRTLAGVADGDTEMLCAEERQCVARAIPTRQREFAAGRLMAREALRAFGAPDAPLIAAQDRRPLWPRGFVGSISHAGGACVVTVGRSDLAASVGIDLEVDGTVERGVARLVCRPAELARMESLDEQAFLRSAKVVFSTKEAVYKCLHPLTGIYLDFHAVEVELDLDAGRFRARVMHPPLAQGAYARLDGRVVCSDGWILSAVSIPPIVGLGS